MHQSINAVHLKVDVELQRFSHAESLSQAGHPKTVVDGLIAEGEYTHGDGPNLVMSAGDKSSVSINDVHHFPFLGQGSAI